MQSSTIIMWSNITRWILHTALLWHQQHLNQTLIPQKTIIRPHGQGKPPTAPTTSKCSLNLDLPVWNMVPTDLEKGLNLNSVLKSAWFFKLPWKWEIFLESAWKWLYGLEKYRHQKILSVSVLFCPFELRRVARFSNFVIISAALLYDSAAVFGRNQYEVVYSLVAGDIRLRTLTLMWVMASSLTVLRHHPNMCWLTTNAFLWHLPDTRTTLY